ncbi:MAG: AAA family ATPase [Sandaracinus sp.]
MRILALRGARLASLEAPFEIDLSSEPLRSAGVFAIVGPTGAGKSSLLDALCLALFDTTPRLERTPRQRLDEDDASELTARDARTLVRRGARDAYAEVDFVGGDGRSYRARWSVERARTGRLRAAELSLTDLASGRVTSGTKGEVLAATERALGIGLAELRRAVLLPQGEVAAFLDAPADERARLLERLTGAEIFAEVSRVVHEKAAAATRARENAATARAMLAVLEPSERERLESVSLAAKLDAARAEEKVGAWVAQRERRALVARLREEESQARLALAELERQRTLVELSREEVERAERAEPGVEPLGALRRAEASEREARARLEIDARASTEAEAALGPAQAARERATEARQAQAARARGSADQARASVAQAKAALEAVGHVDESVRAALQAEERELVACRAALQRWTEAAEAERTGTALAREGREAAMASASRVKRLDARASELALDAAAQAARLDEAQRARDRAIAARSLDAHRDQLVDGEPCPLCGATEHPHGREGGVPRWIDESVARASTIALALDRTRTTLGRVQGQLKASQREVSVAEQRAAQGAAGASAARERAAAIETELALRCERLGVSAAREALGEALVSREARCAAQRARLEEALGRERAAQRELAETERRLREVERASESEGRALEEARARAEQEAALVAERARALAEAAARQAQLVAVAARSREEAGAALALELDRLGLDRPALERIVDVDRARLRRARADLERIDRERASARARLEEREARRAAEELALEQAAGPAPAELDQAIDDMKRERDGARRAEAAAQAALEQDRALRERANALDAAIERARAEEARWEGLDALIGAADGKRFRAHAQSITLERLLAFANAELAQLAPRYTLVRAPAAGELALAVVDAESGPLRRSVQSLSGGETFLVSLALALGLASMTASEGGRGTLRTSSLFLDEGLGALDPTSLEIALGALEALRASGRQIAIVTHVPQVAERFAARVEVTPRGAGRSEVRVLHA